MAFVLNRAYEKATCVLKEDNLGSGADYAAKKLRQPPYCENCISIHEKRSVLHGFRFEPRIWESYVGTEGR